MRSLCGGVVDMSATRQPIEKLLPLRVGLWEILGDGKDVADNSGRRWRHARCKCHGCGILTEVNLYNLRNKKTLGCKKCHKGGRPSTT